jgi:hypothetical protein
VKSENKREAARKHRVASKKRRTGLEHSNLPEDVRIMVEMEAARIVDELLCVAVKPGAKIPLALAKYERDLVLNHGLISMGLTEPQIAELKAAKSPKLEMTLNEWEDFHGYVCAEANHCSDERKQTRLDNLAERMDLILRRHKESRTRKPGTHIIKSFFFPE